MNESELPAWSVHAYREEGRRGSPYSVVGPRPYVALHGFKAPIVPVTVTETGADDPAATHWGWIEAGDDAPEWALVWPSRAQYEVCFPYGVRAEEERGKGRTVRLRVEEVNEVRMREAELPAWPAIKDHALLHLHTARTEMSEVRDWLQSDWRPLGSPLPDAEANARSEVLRIAGQVKGLIDRAKNLLQEAGDA